MPGRSTSDAGVLATARAPSHRVTAEKALEVHGNMLQRATTLRIGCQDVAGAFVPEFNRNPVQLCA